MTPLRQRMIEDMQLRGLSPATQESYVRAITFLARHFNTPLCGHSRRGMGPGVGH